MDPLQTLSDVIAQLDAVVSFAVASVSAPVPYVRPRLLADGTRRMELLQSRHPCMEADADTAFIPNDISFVQGEKSFYIITGEEVTCPPSAVIQFTSVGSVFIILLQLCTSNWKEKKH